MTTDTQPSGGWYYRSSMERDFIDALLAYRAQPLTDDYIAAHLREVEERERAGWEVCPLPPSPWQKRLSLWRLRRLTEAMREAVEQGRLEL